MTEGDTQNNIRIEAAKIRMHLWRNNSGALQDVRGRLVRYGLGNDSTASNKMLKSSDLVGIWGGRFVSIECKAPGWSDPFAPGATRKPTERERAQRAWLDLVAREGGCACFATCWDDVRRQFGI
jgi:hypothetical protein